MNPYFVYVMNQGTPDPTKTETCEECGEPTSGSDMYGDGKCENCTEMCTCCDERVCAFADEEAQQ